MNEITVDLDARYEMIPVLARQYLDAPGKLFGRDPNDGIDCLGLVAMAATQAGFDCPNMLIRTPDPQTGRRPRMMEEAVAKDMIRVGLADLRIGDMLWLKIPSYSPFIADNDHLAIVSGLDPLTMVHSDPRFIKAVREHRVSDEAYLPDLIRLVYRVRPKWAEWIVGAWRFQYVRVEESAIFRSVVIKSAIYGHTNIRRIVPQFGTTRVFSVQ